MLVESVGDATGAVDGGLGERGLVEEHVHEVAQEASGRAAIVIARIEIVGADEHVVAGHEAHFLVAADHATTTTTARTAERRAIHHLE